MISAEADAVGHLRDRTRGPRPRRVLLCCDAGLIAPTGGRIRLEIVDVATYSDTKATTSGWAEEHPDLMSAMSTTPMVDL